jgi:hypothetical protein
MSPAVAREAPRAYANPYLAGVALGLVLLAAYVVVGRGLGASGAFASVAATAVHLAAPGTVESNELFASHRDSAGLLGDWLVIEIIGVMLGGLASAALARRLRLTIERGTGASAGSRIALAGTGGAVMGAGAVLARGCTSGQALTGGALLSVGSWLFVGAAFACAYLMAWLLRRQWI